MKNRSIISTRSISFWFISLYISRYHFHKFLELRSKISEKIFLSQIFLFNGFAQTPSPPHPLNGQNPLRVTRFVDDPLWGWTIFGSKMVHLSQTNTFWEKSLVLFWSNYWPISLCQILTFFNRPRFTRMCHYFGPKNEPSCPNQNISENLLINLVPIIHAYLQSQVSIY